MRWRLNVFSYKPGWRKLRNAFLKENPRCAACGWDKKLEAHHVVPAHIDSSRVLDWNNLIALCRPCHFAYAHRLDFRIYDPAIRELCSKLEGHRREIAPA